MARAPTPGPRPAVLTVENDETRVLREKVEAFEAQDQDRMQTDLKKYSDAFNQRLRSLEAGKDPPKHEPTSPGAPFRNPNDAFVEKVCASQGFCPCVSHRNLRQRLPAS
ncbi:hypothetical protein C8A01DRAFT_15347 [Parachaetomium inaequale]|uniref:Uncharacterized protein n=1 Tax=Parachaetomium inaequale TaxID=2588326 RepID=A0AAN6PGW9_9PEZI|nr:hypothetical protein C8A01DRAFT_15347 [Parachaetomium inaequale]